MHLRQRPTLLLCSHSDLAKDAAVRKLFIEWEKKSVNQSQNTQFSVELKISLQNAIFFFDYKPDKEFLRNCQDVLDIKVSKELRLLHYHCFSVLRYCVRNYFLICKMQ